LAETGRLLRRPQRKLSQPVLSLLRPHNFFALTRKRNEKIGFEIQVQHTFC